MHKIPHTFFNRSAVIVARELLGCYLVTRTTDGIKRSMITETEAYEGPLDQASHAFRGRTKRSDTMFQKPGTIYVYLIYGMHYMANIVTGARDYPAAVLIRSVEGIRGPGNVAKAFGITKSINGLRLGLPSNLWIEYSPLPSKNKITKTPRIGVSYAGPIWAHKKYRFVLS